MARWSGAARRCRKADSAHARRGLMGMQPFGMPILQILERKRPAEQKPLNLIGVPGLQVMPLRFGFHAFRYRFQPQALGHGDDGVNQRRVAAALRYDVSREYPVAL